MTERVTTPRDDVVAFDRSGSGPGVVFIAGAGPSRATDPVTTETARLLAERGATTVVFDRLGRNESTASGVLDLDRELSAVAAAIDAAGPPAVLVGHSSGCAIALAAADAGLPVRALVLWEAPLAGEPARIREWAEGFARMLDEGRLEEAQAWYMRDMPPEWLEGARRSPAWPQIYAAAPTTRADAEAMAWAVSDDPAARFSRIRVPVLALAGTETLDEMLTASTLIASAIPGARAARVAGAHHSWEPAAMAETLAEFLSDLPTPATTTPIPNGAA